MTGEDEILAVQIGRPLRAASAVVKRCSLSLPVVAEVPPLLDSGEPFPTLYWLSCPLACLRVSRLEAAGGVRAAQAQIAADPALRARLADAHARYAAARDQKLPDGAALRPAGGIAGARDGVKCLHAHLADTLAGNDNPVGTDVHEEVGPLACTIPCVVVDADGPHRNPEWREPDA